MLRKFLAVFILLGGLIVLVQGSHGKISAQETAEATAEATTDPTPVPPITVSRSEPTRITGGQQVTLSVFGTNFTNASVVRLVGVGLIATTFVNATALTAVIPANVPAGEYAVEVSDPQRGTAGSPNTLVVIIIPTPVFTTVPVPTVMPTPVPGTPALLVRSYTANPSTIQPGQSTTLTVEIVNIGNKIAQSVSLQVDPSGAFSPANGQITLTLPNIAAGGSYTASLTVTAKTGTNAGPNVVTLNMAYRDELAAAYTSTAAIPVNIRVTPEASQLTLSRYMVNPNPVRPGQPVTVTVLLTNSGNKTASQVLFRVNADDVLLAGPQGDSFPLGDLAPGASVSQDLPLVVST
ncbi:MAG: hypothetical protein K8I60_03465, partial [Anaerolineae bacterium]|nr:hypothetical protein [Anaerolineae bacterium]